jgi:hypothetical protein
MVLRTDLNDRSLESPHDFATTCGVCYFDIPNVYFICEYCRPTRMDDPAFLCPNCYFQEEQHKKHTTICNKLYQDRKEYWSHKRTKQHDSKEEALLLGLDTWVGILLIPSFKNWKQNHLTLWRFNRQAWTYGSWSLYLALFIVLC